MAELVAGARIFWPGFTLPCWLGLLSSITYEKVTASPPSTVFRSFLQSLTYSFCLIKCYSLSTYCVSGAVLCSWTTSEKQNIQGLWSLWGWVLTHHSFKISWLAIFLCSLLVQRQKRPFLSLHTSQNQRLPGVRYKAQTPCACVRAWQKVSSSF